MLPTWDYQSSRAEVLRPHRHTRRPSHAAAARRTTPRRVVAVPKPVSLPSPSHRAMRLRPAAHRELTLSAQQHYMSAPNDAWTPRRTASRHSAGRQVDILPNETSTPRRTASRHSAERDVDTPQDDARTPRRTTRGHIAGRPADTSQDGKSTFCRTRRRHSASDSVSSSCCVYRSAETHPFPVRSMRMASSRPEVLIRTAAQPTSQRHILARKMS